MLAEEIGEGLRSWRARALDRIEGLDEDEYFWEPVAGCWSVRRADNGRWSADLGPRGVAACGRSVAPRVRRQVVHTDPAGQRAFGTAAEAIAAFDRHWTAVADSVVGFADTDLLNAVGAVGGRFGGGSMHGLVLHVADELIHHGAEIGVLRDLYRAGVR